MAKKLTLFLFLTFLSPNLTAMPNYVIFEEMIDGAENFSYIEALTNAQNEHSGFIFCDSAYNQIIIDDFDRDSLIYIDVEGAPVKAIHYYSEDFDSLFIFTILSIAYDEENSFSKIVRLVITDNINKQEYAFVNHISFAVLSQQNRKLNIDFERDANGKVSRLKVERSIHYREYYNTIGVTSEVISHSGYIDINTGDILIGKRANAIESGNLYSTDKIDYVTFYNSAYYYDYRDFPEDDNFGSDRYSQIDIYDDNNEEIFSNQLDINWTSQILVNNFKPSSPTDELIYHGHGTDILNYYSNSIEYIACYSFSEGQPEELWYNDEISDIKFDFVFNQKDLLIGTRGHNEVVMLDYLNGQISDSSNLERDLSNLTFFETGEVTKTLNLTGSDGNKVFVYQFDMATSISETSSENEIIPLSFKLFPNHPNPFNGETRIEFETEEAQHLKLSIFNILGQEVKALASKTFAPGTYQYYWDGNNKEGLSQASGIYFARLEASSGSTMIKLIYMK